jgi:hypothetical protein
LDGGIRLRLSIRDGCMNYRGVNIQTLYAAFKKEVRGGREIGNEYNSTRVSAIVR